MTGLREQWLDLPAGRFRVLAREGQGAPIVFLHGLTATAEAWRPTIERLPVPAPPVFAFDQRGHGHSPKPASGYAVRDYVNDLLAVCAALSLERPHLVGHSMGGRVAIVAAARYPSRFRSVAIVDIGPEAWRANWVETHEGLDALPDRYPTLDAAVEAVMPRRLPEGPGAPRPGELRAVAAGRFAVEPGGSARWRADHAALKQAVQIHRSRDYWRDWERISIPALLIRGERSRELRPRIADEMRRRNPRVHFEEVPGVGHNIPLFAPGVLARLLARSWRGAD